MLVREKVMDTIKSMPVNFSIDDLVEHLIVLDKIERGLLQIQEGQFISHEDVKEKVKTCIK